MTHGSDAYTRHVETRHAALVRDARVHPGKYTTRAQLPADLRRALWLAEARGVAETRAEDWRREYRLRRMTAAERRLRRLGYFLVLPWAALTVGYARQRWAAKEAGA